MQHANADEPVLACQNLVIEYGALRAVDDVSFGLHANSITAILGPSGSGKSSVLRAIAGFVPLASGSIVLNDKRLSDQDSLVPPERRHIGIAVQDRSLFPHLTAQQNVAFGLKGDGAAADAMRWLERIGLSQRASAYPHELSGGEQQRVALARALAPKPDLMLLDEAFSSLDPDLRTQLRRETLSILREAQVPAILVTHDPDEAMEAADQLMVMASGRLLQSGRPEDCYSNPVNRTVARILGEVNVFSGVVQGGRLETPFGLLPCPQIAEGRQVDAIVRPKDLRLGLSITGRSNRVIGKQFLGSKWRIEVSTENGAQAFVEAELGNDLDHGSMVDVAFVTDRVTVIDSNSDI